MTVKTAQLERSSVPMFCSVFSSRFRAIRTMIALVAASLALVVAAVPAASADDRAAGKNAVKQDISRSNHCFRTDDEGKALAETACDFVAISAWASRGQVFAQNQLG